MIVTPQGQTPSAGPTAADDVFVSGGTDTADTITLTTEPGHPGLAATLTLSGFVDVQGDLQPTDAMLGSGTFLVTGEFLASSAMTIGGSGIVSAVTMHGGYLGTSGEGSGTTTTLAAGSSVTGYGQIQGVVHDDGLIDVTGPMTFDDTVDGSGTIRVEGGGNLTLYRGCDAAGIDLVGTGGHVLTLIGGAATAPTAPISGLSAGDRIFFEGGAPDTVTTSTGADGRTIVTLSDAGTVEDSLVLAGALPAGTTLALEQTTDPFYAGGSPANELIVVPAVSATPPPPGAGTATGDQITWTDGQPGAWNDSSNWYDSTLGQNATVAPGALDQVTISGGVGGVPQLITGSGDAALVAIGGGFGNVLLDGTFHFGTLEDETGSASLGIAPGATLSVSGDVQMRATLELTGAGATMTVDGTLTADAIDVDGGAILNASTLVLTNEGVALAPTGTLLVGGTAAAVPGEEGQIVVESDGRLVIDATGVDLTGPILPAFIDNGGVVELRAGTLSGTEVDGGTIQVDGGDGITGNDSNNQIVNADFEATADTTIRFAGSNAGLYLTPTGTSPTAPLHVQGFADTDELEFSAGNGTLSIDTDAERTIVTADGTDGAPLVFEFDGDYRGDSFSLQTLTDEVHQTYYGIVLNDSVSCFCPGTLLATPGAERPVEQLRIGDPVLTAAGTAAPILWIGRRTYPAHVAANRPDLHPVLILAGALGGGLPRRDLLVSPEHAVLVNDALVPAHLLVNDVSILREPPAVDLTYLHVELEHHDLLLAEGAPAESFVDDGGRSLFDNAAEYRRLYPERPDAPPAWCAPRVEHGPALLAAQRHVDHLAGLADRAPPPPLLGRLDENTPDRLRGWAWCPDHPAAPVLLEVLADGAVVSQVLADRFRADLLHAGIGNGCHGFDLPNPATGHTLRLRRATDGIQLAA